MNKDDFSRLMISISRKMVIVLSGLILSLALLEVGLRLGGFILSSMQGYENFQSTKQKGAYRILCLGESTTERKYPHLLEGVLNKRNIGMHFSVIDKGRSTANTDFILSRVESYLAEYHPDMVVAMMGNNDKLVRYYQDIPEAETWIFRHCRVYRFGRMLVMHILKKIRREEIYGLSGSDQGRKAKTEDAGTVSEKEDLLNQTSTEKIKKLDFRGHGESHGTRSSYLSGDRISEAETSLKKAIEMNPENDRAYAELGGLYRLQDKFSQAEDLLKKALELNPKNNNAYAELGWLYLARGGPRQAEDFFKKTIELDPKNDCAYALLGRLYREQGEFSKAEDLSKTALELNPRNIIASFQLCWLYRKQGKLSQAESLLKKVIELNPKNERLLAALASLYEEMGKPELAKEYMEKAHPVEFEENAAVTVKNYRKLKEILDRKGIKLVCVQYPMRNVEPLKKIFEKDKGVIFVDNERVFTEAVKQSGYKEYFKDMFAGDFGHCTRKGNELLAQNIADVILREIFHR
jgi:Tfp pilus assembly protein PilF